jgi:hypothetical protein
LRKANAACGYFAFAPLAGGSCDIGSWVGLRGRLIGILSGLLDPPEPEAASGGLAIGAWLSRGTPGAVCANALAPLASSAASAMLAAVDVGRVLCFMLFSLAMSRAVCGPVACHG